MSKDNHSFFYFLINFLLFFFISGQINSQTLFANFSFDKNPPEYCIGDSVKFTNLSTGKNTQKWDFNDGYETYFENPLHSYFEPGVYDVNLTVFDSLGNTSSFSDKLTINELPGLTFTPSFSDTTIYQGQSIKVNTSGNFEKITWSDGSDSKSILITLSGTYTAEVVSSNLCILSDSFFVTVKDILNIEKTEIIISNNILTPNGDGINDFLIIENLSDYEYPCEIFIYDTAGKRVFSDTNYKNNWSAGSKNGKQLASGTYYYIVHSTNRKGGTGFIDIVN